MNKQSKTIEEFLKEYLVDKDKHFEERVAQAIEIFDGLPFQEGMALMVAVSMISNRITKQLQMKI